MTVKIIAENILVPGDFSTATEQEGEFIGQPVPDSANTGAFRLLSKGDIADFSYSGTATTDGAGGGVTVIDSVLAAYGDDYFIGGTVAITDFLQDTADFTEEDVPARIALTDANTVTVTALDTDEECRLGIDMGIGFFDTNTDDYTFVTKVNVSASTGSASRLGIWALTMADDCLNVIDVASGDFLAVNWYQDAGAHFIELLSCNNGALAGPTGVAVSTSTDYWAKIFIDASVGTNGTVYLTVYDDAALTSVVGTANLAIPNTNDWQYWYWVQSWDEAVGGGQSTTGVISDLKIVKSESKQVNGFAQTTGTMTVAAFTYQVNTGTEFTLTVPFSTRTFEVELVAGGDAGDSTFKWNHDGTTYLGRDDPYQATYQATTSVGAEVTRPNGMLGPIRQMANGDVLAVYYDDANDKTVGVISSDRAITWGSEFDINTTSGQHPKGIEVLTGGRVILNSGPVGGAGFYIHYSDDHGVTWSDKLTISTPTGISGGTIRQLSNGNCILAFSVGTDTKTSISSDGCITWSASVTVDSNADASNMFAAVEEIVDGNIFVAYHTDQSVGGDFEIKGKLSTDGGVTYGSAIDVIDTIAGGIDITFPFLMKDINGNLLCAAYYANGINCSRSTDNAASWDATATIIFIAPANVEAGTGPQLALIDGHKVICTYFDNTTQKLTTAVRGYWEAFAANACPCAIEAIEQKLICDVGIVWHGGAGIAADDWTFAADYDYSMKNLITDSPGKSWRSEQDDIACNIVLDMGANERFQATGAAFFGCNVRALDFQMSTDNEWGTPDVEDEALSFNLVTGTLQSDDGNLLQDDSVLANYKDHELKNKYLRMTAGALDDTTWKLKDNVGNYFVVDAANADISAVGTDNFEIFQSSIAKTFTGGNARYLNVAIAAHNTADGYYEIGTMVVGVAISLDHDWGRGYAKELKDDIEILRTPGGGMIPIKGSENKRIFEVSWNISEDAREQIVALKNYLDGKNLALIPDHDTLTDCYLVKMIGSIRQQQVYKNTFQFSLLFEEVL